jgi:energy-coupling factor transporter ATP-binding protein EcfA2
MATTMTDRVLAEQMRPASLDSLIGQDATVHSVQTQLASGRIPHLFIIYGPSGSGKTTLAKILAETLLQGKNDTNAPSSSRQSRQSRSANLREINAANHNGVDDVRALIESMRFRPLPPCPAKVVILDEAHKLTDPAQNALLTATEDAAGHVYYIFCTTAFTKLLPALRRRTFVVSPTPLTPEHVRALVQSAADIVGTSNTNTNTNTKDNNTEAYEPLLEALEAYEVTSPGLVLQATERYFTGISAQDAVLVTHTDNTSLNTMAVARAVCAGNWKACSAALRETDMTKADAYPVKICVLGYLRKALLNTPNGQKATALADAITGIAGQP